jgi:hypothetical protein
MSAIGAGGRTAPRLPGRRLAPGPDRAHGAVDSAAWGVDRGPAAAIVTGSPVLVVFDTGADVVVVPQEAAGPVVVAAARLESGTG